MCQWTLKLTGRTSSQLSFPKFQTCPGQAVLAMLPKVLPKVKWIFFWSSPSTGVSLAAMFTVFFSDAASCTYLIETIMQLDPSSIWTSMSGHYQECSHQMLCSNRLGSLNLRVHTCPFLQIDRSSVSGQWLGLSPHTPRIGLRISCSHSILRKSVFTLLLRGNPMIWIGFKIQC